MNFDFNQQPITDQTIDDVGMMTLNLLKTKYRKVTTGIIIFGVSLIIAGLAALLIGYQSELIVWMAAMAFGIPVILYAYVYSKVAEAFMQQFAKLNGYIFNAKGTLDDKLGYIFQIGHGKTVYNHITGTYQNCPIELFNYRYTVGSGKNSHTYRKTIFSIDFQSIVPHITLRKNRLIDFGHGLGEKITLEGLFSDKFDLFVQKGFNIEALQIFAPDFMAQVESWNFELEFIGTKLYVYAEGSITKKADLLHMYDAAKYLAARLDPLLDKMKSGIESMFAAQK